MKISFQNMRKPKRKHKYRTAKEAYYFGSDLNKFMHHFCTERMDVINIDCMTYRAERGFSLRFIESKHTKENLTNRQNKLYGMIARLAQFPWAGGFLPFQFFTVYGDFPFHDVIIRDMKTGKRYRITDRKVFIRWLEHCMGTEELEEYHEKEKAKKALQLSE